MNKSSIPNSDTTREHVRSTQIWCQHTLIPLGRHFSIHSISKPSTHLTHQTFFPPSLLRNLPFLLIMRNHNIRPTILPIRPQYKPMNRPSPDRPKIPDPSLILVLPQVRAAAFPLGRRSGRVLRALATILDQVRGDPLAVSRLVVVRRVLAAFSWIRRPFLWLSRGPWRR